MPPLMDASPEGSNRQGVCLFITFQSNRKKTWRNDFMFPNMSLNSVKAFVREEEGQDVVEYSLLLVLIAAASVFVLTAMGSSITSIFSKVNTRLSTADKAIS
jgi:pilus assembly protein Flp/PilA